MTSLAVSNDIDCEPLTAAMGVSGVTQRFPFADYLFEINDALLFLDGGIEPSTFDACRHRAVRLARRILTSLSACYAPGVPLERLPALLEATPFVEALLAGLSSIAQRSPSELNPEDVRCALLLLREVVYFVGRRRSSEAALTDALRIDDSAGDLLFDLKTLFDVPLPGFSAAVSALSISARARLIGHAGETLALRLRFTADGAPVKVRPGWESWCDRARLELAGSARSFALAIPLVVSKQRVLLDDLHCLVPYQALDLPAHRCRLAAQLSITSDRGEVVCTAERSENARIVSATHCAPFPSPAENGFSQRDPLTGDALSDIALSLDSITWGGTALLSVSCSSTITRVSLPAQRASLEMRVRDGDGAYVGSADARFRSPRGEFLLRSALSLSEFPLDLARRTLQFPVGVLELEARTQRLWIETLVRRVDGKILCGVLAPIVVPLSHAEQAAARGAAQEQIQVQSGSLLKRLMRGFSASHTAN